MIYSSFRIILLSFYILLFASLDSSLKAIHALVSGPHIIFPLDSVQPYHHRLMNKNIIKPAQIQPHHHHHHVTKDKTRHYPVHNHVLSDMSTIQIPQPHRPFSSNPSYHTSSQPRPISPWSQTYAQCEASQLNSLLSPISSISCEKLLKNQLKLPLLRSMLLTSACARIQGANEFDEMIRALALQISMLNAENREPQSTTIEVTTTTSDTDQKINDALPNELLLSEALIKPETGLDDDTQNDDIESSHYPTPSSP
ncbi:1066_t:CDS:1, partial [Dentiscutata erythropus]